MKIFLRCFSSNATLRNFSLKNIVRIFNFLNNHSIMQIDYKIITNIRCFGFRLEIDIQN